MFDQQPQNQNFNQSNRLSTNNQPPVPKPNPTGPPLVEDIFSQTESSLAPEVARPMPPGQVRPTSVYSGGGDVFGGRSLWQNKIWRLLLIVVLAAIIGGGLVFSGFFAFNFFKTSQKPPTNINQAINQNINQNADINTNNNVNQNINNNANTNEGNVLPEPAKDSDNDGLMDDEEEALGTDPKNFDTDADGLIDRMEIKVFLTDPKNPDTDGDGYKDGEEVINGYDPTKPGNARLYGQPPQ